MTVAYRPTDFWRVVFWRTGSAVPKIMPRVLLVLPFGVLAGAMQHLEFITLDMQQFFHVPGLIIGLLVSFRLNFAYDKWERGMKCILDLHGRSRAIICKLCAYCGTDTQEKLDRIAECRRWIVLTCVLIKHHVRNEADITPLSKMGLLTEAEVAAVSERITTYSASDGKQDHFPSRNRPSYALAQLHRATTALYTAGHFPSFNHHLAVEADLSEFGMIFEQIEYLGLTIIPLPYAQLTRVVSLFYCLMLPFGVAEDLKWAATITITVVVCIIYFTIDEVSSQMETPFAGRENDVDLEKMIRRIDKHTASVMSEYTGRSELNFDIFPETRRTDGEHHVMKGHEEIGSSLYELQQPPKPMSRAQKDDARFTNVSTAKSGSSRPDGVKGGSSSCSSDASAEATLSVSSKVPGGGAPSAAADTPSDEAKAPHIPPPGGLSQPERALEA